MEEGVERARKVEQRKIDDEEGQGVERARKVEQREKDR